MSFLLFQLSSPLLVSGILDTFTYIYFTSDFGFLQNGTYSFNFTFDQTERTFQYYLLMTTSEESYYSRARIGPVPDCSESYAQLNHSFSNTGPITIQNNIPTEDVYTPIIIKYNSTDKYRICFKGELYNQGNRLDSRLLPTLVAKPIAFGLDLLLTILVIIYFLIKKAPLKSVYGVIILAFLQLDILLMVDIIRLDQEKEIEDPYAIIFTYNIFKGIFTFVFVTAFMLFAHGFGLIELKLSISQWIYIIGLPLVFAVSFTVDAIDNPIMGILKFLFEIISLIAIIIIGYLSLRKTKKKIRIHLKEIADAGIDPLTTPVYIKLRMLHWVSKLILFSAIIVILTLLIEAFAGASSWIREYTIYLALIVILAIFAAILRPRGSGMNEFMKPLVEPVEERKTVIIEEIGMIEIEKYGGKGKVWDETMKLPPEPIFVKSYKDLEEPLNNGMEEEVAEPIENFDKEE